MRIARSIGRVAFPVFLAGLWFAPSQGRAAAPTVDSILLDFQATEKMRKEIATSIVSVEAEGATLPLIDPQSIARRRGCAVAVEGPTGPVFLVPSHIVRGTKEIEIRLKDGTKLTIEALTEDKEYPISLLWVKDWPPSILPLKLAAEKSAQEGTPAFTLTQIANVGFEVISRVHLLGRMNPPLAMLWVTDVVDPGGSPLITVDKRLLALPFRILGSTVHRTMAAGPDTLGEILRRNDVPQKVSSPRVPQDN